MFKRSLDLREAPVARLSSGIVSSGFPPPAPEGRHGIGQLWEVGCRMRTSAAVYYTHYSTVLRKTGKKKTNNWKQQFVDDTVTQLYFKWTQPAVLILRFFCSFWRMVPYTTSIEVNILAEWCLCVCVRVQGVGVIIQGALSHCPHENSKTWRSHSPL